MSKTCTCSPRDGACADHAAYFAERARILGDVAEIAATLTESDEAASADPGVCLCGAPSPEGRPCGGCAV